MRRLARIIGPIAVVVLAAILTVPWWFGAALSRVGPSFGLSIGSYERVGYARFRIRDAEYRRPPVQIQVATVEADTPILWAWRFVSGSPRIVQAGTWTVKIAPPEPRKTDAKPRGWVPLRRQLDRVADRLDRWLPEATVGSGVVNWPGGELRFASATWQRRTLTSPRVDYGRLTAAVELNVPAREPWRAALRAEEVATSAVLESQAAEVTGEIVWSGQRGRIRARFEPQGWRPQQASLDATDWDVAAERARLGTHYSRLRGGAHIDWRDGQWTATATAEGEPLPKSAAPPLRVNVKGHGDGETFVAESFDVVLPGATARLTDPVTLDRTGRLRSGASRFVFEADLAQLTWINAAGKLTGEGRLTPGNEGRGSLDFDWHGEHLVLLERKLGQMKGRGRLAWPSLELQEGQLLSESGDELHWSGGWNFATRELSRTTVSGRLSRELFAPWLPAKLGFDTLQIEARAEGPLKTLSHEGSAEVQQAQTPGLKPLAVALRWRGRGDVIENFSAAASGGETKLTLTGAADRHHVTLASLQLSSRDKTPLQLMQPATVRWDDSGLLIDAMQLAGPDARITVEGNWGRTGRLQSSIQGLRAVWLRELVSLPPVRWTLESLTLDARWNDGPAEYSAESRLSVDLGDERSAELTARVKGGAAGIEVESLRVAEGDEQIINASGHLPVVIRPVGEPWLALDFKAPFAVDATTLPSVRLWSQLSQLTGVTIVGPEARASLRGMLEEPRGEAEFRAERIVPAASTENPKWPKIEKLDLRVVGTSAGVNLERLEVLVEGQTLRASGALPVVGAGWRELLGNPRQFVRRGALHVEVPDADLAALAQHVPAYLAPKGRAQLDLTFGADEGLRGFLRVQDATLRPIGPLGVVQGINADIRFAGRSATIESVTGRMGGQLVTLRGRAELPAGETPLLDFTLRGENLPFVRRAGLLVRGDLDLSLTTLASGPVKIGGTVRLRDSLFLTDVRSLIPRGNRSGGSDRPPYFAVSTPPLNRWELDVAVEGSRFMRLRTPVFNGVASARFRLSGTLGEPQAIGEATVDEGNVRLPFANFSVRQGQVRLTAEQAQPQIWLTATTRRYGYDLRMELTGPVIAPSLTFNSSPPLEAEQVLLLVMTGQPPNDENATTESQRVARMGAFVGQSLLGSFSGETGGADRLSISSGENASEQGRETYNIEYSLDNHWAVTGEYDEFDEYYAGLKWRFYEKGGEPDHGKK